MVRSDFARVPRENRRGLSARIVAGASHPLVRVVLARHPRVPPFEGYVIDMVDADGPALVVAAHHFRGTMFGLLELSRRLGVDPLEFFTDVPPRAADPRWRLPIHSPVPGFRYRGLFINQEDLLTGWKHANGPIPLAVHDGIFLSALRLGASMILPATYIAPQCQPASRDGVDARLPGQQRLFVLADRAR